jgi:xanthine dehydrogenase accessory factor
MSEILLESLDPSDESRVVQATLVSATGSSSKKIGAKMLVGASGKLLGGVTIGGCVDAQVIEAGDALITSGGRQMLDISLDDDEAWEIGLTCGGTVEVLIECIAPSDANDPAVSSYAAVRNALDGDRAAVVATALEGSRTSLVIDEDGIRTGTLGDPVADDAAASMLPEVLRTGSRAERLPTANGERRVFFDRFAPPTTLVIVGAGQIAMSLTRFAHELDMRTVVVDGRERYATRDRFPDADEIRLGMPSEIVAELAPGKRNAVILVAHDYKYELPVLRNLLRSTVGYLGMLGSKKRGAAVRDLLREEGFSDDELSRIRTPIGLDIGGKSSPEVALSILAEIVAIRSGKRV